MRNILITGATKGIGKAIALRLSLPGNCLILTGRDENGLKEVSRNAEERGARALYVTADLEQQDAPEKIFSFLRENVKALDILINNAGVSEAGLIQDSSEEALEKTLSVNLTAAIRLSKEAVKMMVPQKSGRIINISSVYGIYGASFEAEYSASKGALNAFTKALAKELAPSSIPVNAVAPGAIDTDMNSRLTAEEKNALAEEIPAGRLGTPEEVADTVALLTEAPLYLTGDIIEVAGGWF